MLRNFDQPKLTTHKAMKILERPKFGDPEQIRAHKFLELRNEAIKLAKGNSWCVGDRTYDLYEIDEDTLENLLKDLRFRHGNGEDAA
jgi:hypothetical protein